MRLSPFCGSGHEVVFADDEGVVVLFQAALSEVMTEGVTILVVAVVFAFLSGVVYQSFLFLTFEAIS